MIRVEDELSSPSNDPYTVRWCQYTVSARAKILHCAGYTCTYRTAQYAADNGGTHVFDSLHNATCVEQNIVLVSPFPLRFPVHTVGILIAAIRAAKSYASPRLIPATLSFAIDTL